MTRMDAFKAVNDERDRQDAKWGTNVDKTIERMLVVLMEEVGELSEAYLNNRVDGPHSMRVEAIQTAAVAIKIIEALDRGVR